MAKSKSSGGLIVLLIVMVAAAAGLWYYFNGRSDKEPDIATTKVGRGDIIQAVTATGDLEPVVTVDVGAQVSGQIKEVKVDFNSKVKAKDVLALIDPATAEQKVHSADADLASAKASYQLAKVSDDRTRELFQKKLVSQSELDSADAQLSQANASLMTKQAALENAKLDLEHCTVDSPIDGIVLNRATDVGRTVNASTNSPTLFTLVNDLTKMQINAAVAEADVGMVTEGQDVKFTVDAFPNRTFSGKVTQVRNAATTTQNVVSYAVIIGVNNSDLKLKPGMTANVSIIVAQKNNVLRLANSALRVRIPQEMLPKSADATQKTGATMTDEERNRALRDIMREAGLQFGQPPSAEVIEKAKKLAQDKGIGPEAVDQAAERMAQMAQRKAEGGGGRRDRSGGGGSSGPADRGFTNTVTTRTVYRLTDPAAKEKKIEPVAARLGISDGVNTEVLSGLNENDAIVTGVTMPNSAPAGQSGTQNPFQGSSHSYGMHMH